MEGAKCPYCQAAYKEEDGKCATCKAIFPWAAEIKRLEDDVKSREVNRGRATFTLIEEIYKYGKEGKPVSVAAMKGFAFAWLFPRTVILLGSILAGAVLVVQTAIIYRQNQLIAGQNELMQKQTAAMQLEHAERLRIRVAANSELQARLEELSLIGFNHWRDYGEDWTKDLTIGYLERNITAIWSDNYLAAVELGSLGEALHDIRRAAIRHSESKPPTGYTATSALRQADLRCGDLEKEIEKARLPLLIVQRLSEDVGGNDRARAQNVLSGLRLLTDTPSLDKVDQRVLKEKLRQLGRDIRGALGSASVKCQEKVKDDRRTVLELERKAAPVTSPATASAPSAASR